MYGATLPMMFIIGYHPIGYNPSINTRKSRKEKPLTKKILMRVEQITETRLMQAEELNQRKLAQAEELNRLKIMINEQYIKERTELLGLEKKRQIRQITPLMEQITPLMELKMCITSSNKTKARKYIQVLSADELREAIQYIDELIVKYPKNKKRPIIREEILHRLSQL